MNDFDYYHVNKSYLFVDVIDIEIYIIFISVINLIYAVYSHYYANYFRVDFSWKIKVSFDYSYYDDHVY